MVVTRFRAFQYLGFLLFLLCSLNLTAKGWKDKPYLEWTRENCLKIINHSPWVYISNTPFSGTNLPLPEGEIWVRYPLIRILSAEPIYRAQLRLYSMNQNSEDSIQISDLKDERSMNDEQSAQARIQRLIKTDQADIRVAGDPNYIVISISMHQIRLLTGGVHAVDEAVFPLPELDSIQPAAIIPITFLKTKTGKRVPLMRYRAPQQDKLGALFYFSRTLANGEPAINKADKEVELETWIEGKKVLAKFNLSRMIYKGKLEI